MAKEEVTAKIYDLTTKEGSWLGRVILTSDGSFMSITDWGNYNYSWSSTGCKDFREFILKLNTDYFGTKMFNGICDISSTNKSKERAMIFAEKILPALQEVLRKEIESQNNK